MVGREGIKSEIFKAAREIQMPTLKLIGTVCPNALCSFENLSLNAHQNFDRL